MNIRKGPFTVTNSATVYKNPWITVVEDTVIRPDKSNGIFGVVYQVPGVSVVPIDHENNIYLINEYRYGINSLSIEAASGAVENQEDLQQTAIRELAEETGIKAKKWTHMGYVNPFTTIVVSKNHLFLAEDLEFGPSHLEPGEQIELIKVPLKQAVDWVMQSRISHAGTATAILKVARLHSI